jgi:hypothetical protein
VQQRQTLSHDEQRRCSMNGIDQDDAQVADTEAE